MPIVPLNIPNGEVLMMCTTQDRDGLIRVYGCADLIATEGAAAPIEVLDHVEIITLPERMKNAKEN